MGEEETGCLDEVSVVVVVAVVAEVIVVREVGGDQLMSRSPLSF